MNVDLTGVSKAGPSDLRAIKKQSTQYDLFHRLHSIAADEAFVQLVAQQWFGNRFQIVRQSFLQSWKCAES